MTRVHILLRTFIQKTKRDNSKNFQSNEHVYYFYKLVFKFTLSLEGDCIYLPDKIKFCKLLQPY